MSGAIFLYNQEITKVMKPHFNILELASGNNFDSILDTGTNIYRLDKDSDNAMVVKCNVDKERIPFNDNFFDLVVCKWGVEHFRKIGFLKEVNRVLKEHGRFIFVTTNVLNPIFYMNKILPFFVSNFLCSIFFNVDYLRYKGYYIFNSVRKIKKVSQNSGLVVVKMVLCKGAYNYFDGFMRDFMYLTEQTFGGTRGYIVGVLEKK